MALKVYRRNRDSVQVLQDWGDVGMEGGLGDDSGCSVLDQWKFVDGRTESSREQHPNSSPGARGLVWSYLGRGSGS